MVRFCDWLLMGTARTVKRRPGRVTTLSDSAPDRDFDMYGARTPIDFSRSTMSASGLRRRTPVALAAGLAAVLAVGLSAAPSSAAPPPGNGPVKAPTTKVQILGLNDFHGNLEEPGGSGGRIGAL